MYEACVSSGDEDDQLADDGIKNEDDEDRKLKYEKRSFSKTPIELQRARLDRLMANPEKPVLIPDRVTDEKLPRAFEPHQFVRNVMGASAGAGSGEFDIYRGCRRRERIRQHFLFRQEKMRQLDEEYNTRVEEAKKHFEDKTAKKRRKRQKQKEAKKLKKVGNKSNNPTDTSVTMPENPDN